MARFSEKKKYIEQKMYFHFLFKFVQKVLYSKIIYRDNVTNVRVSLCKVGYILFLSHFKETWILSTDFRTFLNIKFCENPSTGAKFSHAVGQTCCKRT